MISLTPSGTERWVYTYDGSGNGTDFARSVVVGLDGHIYAAGFSEGSGTGADFTVVSLTSSGVERWVYTHNGSADTIDYACSVVYGADGNIYITGWSYDST